MGQTILESPMSWELTRPEINELILKPTFVSDNIFTGTFRVMKNVKDEAKMFFLGAPSKFLQKNNDCKFTPKGSMSLVPDKIQVCRMKVEMEQCMDEVFDSCLEAALTGSEDGIFDPTATPEGAQLQAAMATQISKGLTNDLFLLSSFAKPGETASDGFYDICYPGLFANIDSLVAAGKLTQVNAASGAALGAGAAIALFKGMWNARSLKFKGFELFPGQHELHVTNDLYENLHEYYENLGVAEQYQIIKDGITSLTWRGIAVISHPEWDAELRTTFGLTNPHRAILTLTGNLTVATDLAGTDVSLRIYTDVHMKQLYTQGFLRFGGAKVAFPDLCVFAK